MPKNDGVKVEITGGRELRKALKQIDTELGKELRTGFKGIAQAIVDKVTPHVPRLTGNAAGSYKARGGQRGAAIAFGGPKAEYAPWLEFGGKVGKKNSVERPFIKEGRWLYPTIKSEREQLIEATDDLIDKVVEHAGLDIK